MSVRLNIKDVVQVNEGLLRFSLEPYQQNPECVENTYTYNSG